MLKIKRVSPEAVIPKRAKQGDSGLDLCSTINTVLKSGDIKLVPVGWEMEVPENFEIQIRPRSGLALKYGVTVGNSPGTVDSGFRNQVCVILKNGGSLDFHVKVGDRIAQMVIAPVLLWDAQEVTELSSTERGDSGFGSTGV
jgi:dUTP pyrophosphatase